VLVEPKSSTQALNYVFTEHLVPEMTKQVNLRVREGVQEG